MRSASEAEKQKRKASSLGNNNSSASVDSNTSAKAEGNALGSDESEANDMYPPDLDHMRCMLYFHGGEMIYIFKDTNHSDYSSGGYFFGSIDQERFCIQRHARYATLYFERMLYLLTLSFWSQQ